MNLKNISVSEETPQGKVIMFYNFENKEFVFFADTKEITYNILEVVSRKYVVINDCKKIYKVMPNSINDDSSEESSSDESDNESQTESDSTNCENSESESINDNSSDRNTDEESNSETQTKLENNKNEEKNKKQDVFANFKPYNAVINENNMEELGYIIKKDINKYKYGGRLDDYNKKDEIRPIMNINFETFKEMFSKNKITIDDKKTS